MPSIVTLLATLAIALHGGPSNGKPTMYVHTNPNNPSAIYAQFRNTAHLVLTPGNRTIYYVRTNATVRTWHYTKGGLRARIAQIRGSL